MTSDSDKNGEVGRGKYSLPNANVLSETQQRRGGGQKGWWTTALP